MKSIEAAKIMIENNNEDIDSYRKQIQEYYSLLEKKKQLIAQCERELLRFRSEAESVKELLRVCKENKFKCHVDNLALKAFIDNGGGLDMDMD